MDIEILERFRSKRNQVFKVNIHTSASAAPAVMKIYEEQRRGLLHEEYNNLQMLRKSGLTVPEIIYLDKDRIYMEYIQGKLVNDLVQELVLGDWIEELSRWLCRFHQISGRTGNLLKGDVNLRNFIYDRGNIYGLDFEELSSGDKRTDLGNICFFILTNNPSFTNEKHRIMRRLLQGYEKCMGAELQDMGRYLLQSRAEAKLRRSIVR